MIFQLICCLLMLIMSDESQTNIAKFKPSWQSSSLLSTRGNASDANDGNRADQYWSLSCSETQSQIDAWWIVDLGKQYLVESVILVNRGDPCCGFRLTNFIVDVAKSMSSPTDMSQFQRCYNYPGTAGNGEILDLKCSALQIGRYVKVQVLNYGRLTLCEAEVYAVEVCPQPKTGLFHEFINTKTETAVQSFNVAGGRTHCAVYCMEFIYCRGYTLKTSSDGKLECQIDDGTGLPVAANESSYFSPCQVLNIP